MQVNLYPATEPSPVSSAGLAAVASHPGNGGGVGAAGDKHHDIGSLNLDEIVQQHTTTTTTGDILSLNRKALVSNNNNETVFSKEMFTMANGNCLFLILDVIDYIDFNLQTF